MKNEAATIQEMAADKHFKILPLLMEPEETSMRKKMLQQMMPHKRLMSQEGEMKHPQLQMMLQMLQCKLEQKTKPKTQAEGRVECHVMPECRPKLTCQMNGANGT